MLDRATTDDLSALLRELTVRRRELAELLERYRENPSPELRDQITALLNRLKARSAELRESDATTLQGSHQSTASQPRGLAQGTRILSHSGRASAGSGRHQSGAQVSRSAGGSARHFAGGDGEIAGGAQEENRELAQKLKDFKDDLDEVQRDQTKIANETDNLRRETRQALERRAPATSTMLDELRAETRRAKDQLDQIPQMGLARELSGGDLLSEGKERTASSIGRLNPRISTRRCTPPSMRCRR